MLFSLPEEAISKYTATVRAFDELRKKKIDVKYKEKMINMLTSIGQKISPHSDVLFKLLEDKKNAEKIRPLLEVLSQTLQILSDIAKDEKEIPAIREKARIALEQELDSTIV